MTNARKRWPILLAALALVWTGGPLRAGDLYNKEPAKNDPIVLPKPAEVQALAVYPAKITLKGMDDAAQFIATATLAGNKQQDLSGDVKYEVADAKVVKVTPTGRVLPVGNGSTEITAAYGEKIVKVPVTAESCD